MEIFIHVMETMSGICWLLMCVFSLASHHRDWAIWSTCCAIIFAVIAFFAWYQDLLWKRDAIEIAARTRLEPIATPPAMLYLPNEGYLTPGDGIRPQTNAIIPENATAVFFGNGSVGYTSQSSVVAIRQGKEDMVIIGNDNGSLWLTMKLFSTDDRIMADIIKNSFHINPNNVFRTAKTAHSLQIFDEEGNEAFNLAFINPSTVKVLGSFYLRRGFHIEIRDDVVVLGNQPIHGFSFGGGNVLLQIGK